MTVHEAHFAAGSGSRAASGSELLRRAADVCIAMVVLLLLIPVLVIIVAAIKLAGDGPVIFRQARIGRNRRPFTIYKFRTMVVDASQQSHRQEVLRQLDGTAAPGSGVVAFKPRSDPRVTKVGKLLRRYSLDELPQLVNVLRGEMSVVGPRPSLVWEADAFPVWAEPRFRVKPGLTGLWQVAGRNQLSVRQMLELDVQYADSRSLWKDLGILLRTVPTVLTGRGAA
jgi:lipopolysaccharide/colanic/teichoic acid biosynthesis glycosyltransferase